MKHLFVCATLAALSIPAGSAQAAAFKVSSHSATDARLPAAQFANGMGCSGKNLSPHIAWEGAPEGTKSYVVTMYDPDAPTGSGWWHWVVANVPATVTQLNEGAGSEGGHLPPGAVSIRADSGLPGYTGACPPAGQTHRYVITVTALKVERLDLPAQVTPAMLGFMTLGVSLGKASVTLQGSR